MKTVRAGGFTLIELLSVIAIIMILAGMTFTVGSRMIEQSKVTAMINACKQITTACVAYATKNPTNTVSTYPPAYGYRKPGTNANDPDTKKYFLNPYVKAIDFFRLNDMYDRFSISYDTDNDGKISWLEFSPIGKASGFDQWVFPDTRYEWYQNNLPQETTLQMRESPRPVVYIPVYSKQATKFAEYCYLIGTQVDQKSGFYAMRWVPNFSFPSGKPNPIAGMTFPPPRYDDFVLVSVGPFGSTGGILTPPETFISDLASVPPEDVYHICALRAYYLATRDLNNNNLLDFDYRNRAHGAEANPTSYNDPDRHLTPDLNMNLLPDGTNGAGPLIYRPEAAGIS